MHIEPGLVDGAEIVLSCAAAAAAGAYALKVARGSLRERGALSLAARSAVTSALVFAFFEILPHHTMGLSEVQIIVGSTLLLLFGAVA